MRQPIHVSLTLETMIDAPAGSGPGSSSALVEAFRVTFDLPLGPYDVARLAFAIEQIDPMRSHDGAPP